MYKKNFIHKTAQLYGDIEIGIGSSIWPNAVIRSEMFNVIIGDAIKFVFDCREKYDLIIDLQNSKRSNFYN